MELSELSKKALQIRDSYDEFTEKEGKKPWGLEQRMEGFIGDVGDLMKLVMAKEHYRDIDDLDSKLTHELSDCFWSILVIADYLGINLETEFMKNMDELQNGIDKKIKMVV